jgi:hypothetical protein
MLKRSVGLFFAFLLLVFSCFAAEPQQVIMWPSAGTPVLQFTFSKFRDLGGSVGSQRPFATDTTAKNLSSQLIPHERFTLYVFDRKQIRIGDASMEVSNIGPGETVKFQVTIMTSGSPATLSIAADSDAAKKVSLTINSVPQGALLKVDDVEAGTTPRLISIGSPSVKTASAPENSHWKSARMMYREEALAMNWAPRNSTQLSCAMERC